MASTYGTVTVNTTPTLILAANTWRQGCEIFNNSSTLTLFIGMDTAVTTSTGLSILPQSYLENAGAKDCYRGNIYGRSTSSTINVRFWEWEGG